MAVIGKPIAVHHWEGHRIEIRLRSSPRYMWMAAGFYVRVDDVDVFVPPERFERGTTATPFVVEHAAKRLDGKVESFDRKLVLSTPYKLTLNGALIGEGVLRAENWYITLGILTFVFVVLPLLIALRLREGL